MFRVSRAACPIQLRPRVRAVHLAPNHAPGIQTSSSDPVLNDRGQGMQNGNDGPEDPPHEMSDQEWEIRTGRAIYVLQQTLPEFFEHGLVSSVDRGETPTMLPADVFGNGKGKGKARGSDIETIYSPKVRLLYTPPGALPPPFPHTLHIDGLPLYIASSVFVRHTLKALYTDLRVKLQKITVQSSASRSNGNPPLDPGLSAPPPGETESRTSGRDLRRREKSLFVRMNVSGVARVSGTRGEWDVASTYTFSPISGLISLHTVNSIHPAPHLGAYDALKSALMKTKMGFGFGRNGDMPRPDGAVAVCREPGAVKPIAEESRRRMGE